MTTLQMEIALLEHLNPFKYTIVPNVSYGMSFGKEGTLHECDLLMLSNSYYATEIEIKVSKADLLKDSKKPHGHRHNAIKFLYFAVPEELKEYALKHIPKRSGLYVVDEFNVVKKVKKATINKHCIKWSKAQVNKLNRLGCMRLLTLKKKIAVSHERKASFRATLLRNVTEDIWEKAKNEDSKTLIDLLTE